MTWSPRPPTYTGTSRRANYLAHTNRRISSRLLMSLMKLPSPPSHVPCATPIDPRQLRLTKRLFGREEDTKGVYYEQMNSVEVVRRPHWTLPRFARSIPVSSSVLVSISPNYSDPVALCREFWSQQDPLERPCRVSNREHSNYLCPLLYCTTSPDPCSRSTYPDTAPGLFTPRGLTPILHRIDGKRRLRSFERYRVAENRWSRINISFPQSTGAIGLVQFRPLFQSGLWHGPRSSTSHSHYRVRGVLSYRTYAIPSVHCLSWTTTKHQRRDTTGSCTTLHKELHLIPT
jgi:hypothetical protein